MPYEEFFLQRDPMEVADYQKLYREATARISDDDLQRLPWISFIMLKPDAYLRGLMPELLSAFAQNGVSIVTSGLTSLTEELIDKLYYFVKLKYASSWWIMPKVYTFAPCYPALIVGSPESFPHLSSRIRDLIGPTTPMVGKRGQLRYDFRATDRVCNLIHATDDPASALREALVFFGWADIQHALSVARTLQAGETSIENTMEGAQAAPLPTTPVDLTYSRVLYRVKAGVLDRLVELTSGLDRVFDAEIARFQVLRQEEDRILAQSLPLREELQALWPVTTSQQALASLLEAQANKELTERTRTGGSLQESTAPLAQIVGLAQLLNILLKSDPQLTSVSFETDVLGSIANLSVRVDATDVLMLHTKAAAVAQEVRDLALKLEG